jgi:hypothetical protein
LLAATADPKNLRLTGHGVDLLDRADYPKQVMIDVLGWVAVNRDQAAAALYSRTRRQPKKSMR